jgi:hypothetical protein
LTTDEYNYMFRGQVADSFLERCAMIDEEIHQVQIECERVFAKDSLGNLVTCWAKASRAIKQTLGI